MKIAKHMHSNASIICKTYNYVNKLSEKVSKRKNVVVTSNLYPCKTNDIIYALDEKIVKIVSTYQCMIRHKHRLRPCIKNNKI